MKYQDCRHRGQITHSILWSDEGVCLGYVWSVGRPFAPPDGFMWEPDGPDLEAEAARAESCAEAKRELRRYWKERGER